MSTVAHKLITKARANVFLDHGFFGHMLAKHHIHYTDRVPTLAVDNRRNIYINPEFVMRFKDDNKKLQWALCHEVMHPVLNHLTRRNKRDAKLWNYAGDAVINDLLNTTRVGRPIENTVNMPGSSAKTTEQIYQELEGKRRDQGDKPGDSEGGSGEPVDGDFDNGLGDDIIESEMSESERKELEAQAKVDIAEAAAAAKVRGNLPGALRDFVNRILESEVPWYDKLHEFMQGQQTNDYSWARPNRRYVAQGHYLPSCGKEPKMGEVVIQVDISGSVSEKEQSYFAGHVQRIMTECNPSKVHVLYVDAEVQLHDEFDNAEEVQFRFHSGGGTDMVAGIRYCDKHDITPDVFITLTDGITPYGDAPSFPCVWCISDDRIKATHGITIPFKLKEK